VTRPLGRGFRCCHLPHVLACVAANRTDFAAINRNEVHRGRRDTRDIVAGFEELSEDIEVAIARGSFGC